MITFRVTTDIKDDRRVVLTLPPGVPTGQAELVVTVASSTPDDRRAHVSGVGSDDKSRAEAVAHFLALAQASTFRSTGPYPTRDELHERH